MCRLILLWINRLFWSISSRARSLLPHFAWNNKTKNYASAEERGANNRRQDFTSSDKGARSRERGRSQAVPRGMFVFVWGRAKGSSGRHDEESFASSLLLLQACGVQGRECAALCSPFQGRPGCVMFFSGCGECLGFGALCERRAVAFLPQMNSPSPRPITQRAGSWLV